MASLAHKAACGSGFTTCCKNHSWFILVCMLFCCGAPDEGRNRLYHLTRSYVYGAATIFNSFIVMRKTVRKHGCTNKVQHGGSG